MFWPYLPWIYKLASVRDQYMVSIIMCVRNYMHLLQFGVHPQCIQQLYLCQSELHRFLFLSFSHSHKIHSLNCSEIKSQLLLFYCLFFKPAMDLNMHCAVQQIHFTFISIRFFSCTTTVFSLLYSFVFWFCPRLPILYTFHMRCYFFFRKWFSNKYERNCFFILSLY